MTLRVSLELTLSSLELGDGDAALVAMLRELAGAIEATPGVASLYREFRAGLFDLTESFERTNRTDDLDEMFANLRHPSDA